MRTFLSLLSLILIFFSCSPNQDTVNVIENIPDSINNSDTSLVTIKSTKSHYLLDHKFIQGAPIVFYSDSINIYRAFKNKVDTLKFEGTNILFNFNAESLDTAVAFHSLNFFGPSEDDFVINLKNSVRNIESYFGSNLSEQVGSNLVYNNETLGITSKLIEGNDNDIEEQYVSISTVIDDSKIKSDSLGIIYFSNNSKEEMWGDLNLYKTYGNVFSDIHITQFYSIENNIVTYLLPNFSRLIDDKSVVYHMLSKNDIDSSILFKKYDFISKDSTDYFIDLMGMRKTIGNVHVCGLFEDCLEINDSIVSDKKNGIFLYTFNDDLNLTTSFIKDFDKTILSSNDSIVSVKPISDTKILIITQNYSTKIVVNRFINDQEFVISIPNPTYNIIIYDIENDSYNQKNLSATDELVLLRINLVEDDVYLSGNFKGELSFDGVKDSTNSLSIFSLKTH